MEDSVILTEDGYDFLQLWRDRTVVNLRTGTVYDQSKTNPKHLIIWYKGKSVNLALETLWRKYFANEIANYSEEDKFDLAKLGFPGYTVTRDGKVWNNKYYRWLESYVQKSTGYVNVGLTDEKRILHNEKLHRILALAFIPKENPDYDEVNHIDGDKTNNSLDNLEWCDTYYNGQHARATGLRRSTLSDDDVHAFCKEWVTGKYKTAGQCARALGLTVTACEHILNHGAHTRIARQYGIPYKKPVRLTPVDWSKYPKSKYLKRPSEQQCSLRTPSNCEKKLIPDFPQT